MQNCTLLVLTHLLPQCNGNGNGDGDLTISVLKIDKVRSAIWKNQTIDTAIVTASKRSQWWALT